MESACVGVNNGECGLTCGVDPRSVVQFKEVFLTPEYLAIAMEYAAGGDMFQYVKQRGGLEEAEARWFFQQLIIGMDYCHKMVRASSHSGAAATLWAERRRLRLAWSARRGNFACDLLLASGCVATGAAQASANQVLAVLEALRSPAVSPVGRGKSGYKAGEHAAGWQQAAAAEDLRLWLLQERQGQRPQVQSGHAGVHWCAAALPHASAVLCRGQAWHIKQLLHFRVVM